MHSISVLQKRKWRKVESLPQGCSSTSWSWELNPEIVGAESGLFTAQATSHHSRSLHPSSTLHLLSGPAQSSLPGSFSSHRRPTTTACPPSGSHQRAPASPPWLSSLLGKKPQASGSPHKFLHRLHSCPHFFPSSPSLTLLQLYAFLQQNTRLCRAPGHLHGLYPLPGLLL